MPTLDVIRRLTIRAETQGLEQAAAQLRAIADAGGNVEKGMDAAMASFDKGTGKMTSLANQFATVERRINPAVAEMQRFAQQLTTIQKFAAQNITNPQEFQRAQAAMRGLVESTREYRQEQERLAVIERERASQSASAAQAGMNAAFGIGGPSAASRGATTSALEQLFRDIERKEQEEERIQALRAQAIGEAFTQSLNDSFRIGSRAIDMGATYSALEAEFKRMEEIARARAEHVATTSQQAIAQLTGQNRGTASSARASASVFEEQFAVEEQMQRQAHAVLEAVDPLGQAQKRYNMEIEQYNRLAGAGLLTQRQLTAAHEMAKQKLDVVSRGLGEDGIAGNLRLASHQWTNLGYQLNDITMGLLSGQSPFTIMVQQGGQVYQVLAGARGGVGAGLAAVRDRLVSMVTPASVLGVGLAAAAITAAVAWDRYLTSLKAVDNALTGVGRGTRATASQLVGIAQTDAGAGGMSTAQARESIAVYAQQGRIATDVMRGLLSVQRDFAATTRQDTAAAVEQLAKAFADPTRGAEELNRQLNNLDDTTQQQIRHQQASGDIYGAQRTLLNSMRGTLQDHEKNLTAIGRAWEFIKNAASDALSNIGRQIEPTFEEQAQTALRRFEQSRQEVQGRVNMGRDVSQRDIGRVIELQSNAWSTRFRADADAIQREIQADNARANDLSRSVGDIARQFFTLAEEVQNVTDQIATVNRLIAEAPKGIIPPEEIERARRLAPILEEVKRQLKEMQDAGGRIPFEALRDASRELQAAGSASYEQGLQNIVNRYDDLARAAARAGESVEAVRRAQELSTRAYQGAAVRSDVQSNAGYGFQRDDLQSRIGRLQEALLDPQKLKDAGVSADAAATALARLKQQLENLRTPIEEMLRNYQLELMQIQAVTLEQKSAADAAKAFSDAIDQGRTALEAATAAEIARNRALAEANRQARDALQSARDQAALVGLKPYQRAQTELGQQMRDLREKTQIGPQSTLGVGGSFSSIPGGSQIAQIVSEASRIARDLGVSAKDILTAISYETGGTMNPNQAGPTTKYGQHRGLIQFGEPQAARYGVTDFNNIPQQFQAIEQYLRDAGVRQGDDLKRIYAAINTGTVRGGGRSDTAAGGAWGTADQKVMYQMAGHMERAAQLMSRFGANDNWQTTGSGKADLRSNAGAMPDLDTNTKQMNAETESVRRAAIEYQFLRAPIIQANEALDAQNRMLDAQAASYTGTIAQQVAATEAQRMLNDYISQGVTEQSIGTEAWRALTAEVSNYAQRAGEAAQKQQDLNQRIELMNGVNDAVRGSIGGFVNDLIQGKSAAEAFKNAIGRLAQQLIDLVLNAALKNVLNGLLGSFGGGFGGGGLGTGQFEYPVSYVGHEGTFTGTPKLRFDNPQMYLNAPRLHGGNMGLYPGEKRVIMQEGEGILSRADMAALRTAGSGGGAGVVNNVTVITPPGQQATTKQQGNATGGKDIEVVIQDIAAKGIMKPGTNMNKAVRTMTGSGMPLTRR